MELTDRQQKLLLSIIKEFIKTAEAVGSISLQNKYSLDLSPATIRNEMSILVEGGFLFQKHNSGGRIPTTKGWRFFIESLEESELNKIDDFTKQKIHEELYGLRPNSKELIRKAIFELSRLTLNPAVAIIENEFYYAGLSEMINIPEFREHENLRRILKLMEDYYSLSEILNKGTSDEDVNIIIGEEAENSIFKEYAVIFSEIRVQKIQKGYIAVIGPNRMDYLQIIPSVKYITDTIRYLLSN
jgi:heat-inducible transcriptional repressor